MIDEHTEVEAKLEAHTVSLRDFKLFIVENLPFEEFLHAEGSDVYYEQGDNVVRHRKDDTSGWHEVTVKRRKSEGSTRDREEIDLRFANSVAYESAAAFLLATGFKPQFKLIKDSHIFKVQLTVNLAATFVLYDVWQDGYPERKKRFLEIEAEKGSNVTVETAKRHVSTWVTEMRKAFSLGEPLNESLYEIYSGKRYQTVA